MDKSNESKLTGLLEMAQDLRHYDPALDRAMTRADVCRPTVWTNGQWLAAGIVEYFRQQHAILRELDPTLPTDLPRWCNDISEISRFLGIPLTELRQDQGLEELILELIATSGVGDEALRRSSIFKKFGTHWAIRFVAGDVAEFGIYDDDRGFQHYARLLAEEGHEVSSLVLSGVVGPAQRRRGRQRITDDEDEPAFGELVNYQGFRPQETFTEETARSLIARLEILRAKIDVAKKGHDGEATSSLQDEERRIVEYLKDQDDDQLIGAIRSGRNRIGSASPGEKAHNAVEKAMRRARTDVADQMPTLAKFLKRNVERAGWGFVYRPDPTAPKWLV